MKPLILGTACLLILSGSALGGTGSNWVIQQGNKLCLRNDHIAHKTIVDNRTIIFALDDGTRWKNTLQHDCTGLKLADGFAMIARDNYICANQQPIKIIGPGNMCYLGAFAQVTPAP
jgi:hypothetical protein